MDLLTSREACDRLGVRPQTLYAYVSRGLVDAVKDGTRSLYPRLQIEALAQRTARGRRPGRLELHIETQITLLEPAGSLLYRGVPINEIAGRWSYERTAAWLWTGVDRGEPPSPWPAPDDALSVARRVQDELPTRTLLFHRARTALATLVAVRVSSREQLIATVVEALPEVSPVTGDTIAHRLWSRVARRKADPGRVRALNTALVVLAEHELAASALAARVAASTGAEIADTMLAGMSTLAGPFDGGSNGAIRWMLKQAQRDGASSAVDAAIARWGVAPGAGHRVYRDVDPRFEPLMDSLRDLPSAEEIVAITDDLDQETRRRQLGPLNGEVGLAALAQAYDMVPGAGETIYAIARMAGWAAHADEERDHRLRYRPRAVYTGPRP